MGQQQVQSQHSNLAAVALHRSHAALYRWERERGLLNRRGNGNCKMEHPSDYADLELLIVSELCLLIAFVCV